MNLIDHMQDVLRQQVNETIILKFIRCADIVVAQEKEQGATGGTNFVAAGLLVSASTSIYGYRVDR